MKNLIPKVIGGFGEKKSNGGMQWYQQDRVYSMDGISLALPSQLPGGSYKYLERKNDMERIRKLTPCECWRLQGFAKITRTDDGFEFDDTLFKRAESVCSNTQLYKQAGNSITVDVLEKIFENLFINPTTYEAPDIEEQLTLDDLL